MYQRPRFLEELHEIRAEMSRECDYDVDLFAEMVRSGQNPTHGPARNIRGRRVYAPLNPLLNPLIAERDDYDEYDRATLTEDEQ